MKKSDTKCKRGSLILGIMLLFTQPLLYANNLNIENVSLTGQNAQQNFTLISFDLSWENSWRVSIGPKNWDAAWIFVKFRKNNGPWEHATLNYGTGVASNDGHTEVPGSTIEVTSDGVGAFVHRDAVGTGDIDWNKLQLRWNYGANGVNDNEVVEVQVFGIEMVYVPQGDFKLGGGIGSEVGKIREWVGPLNFSTPYDITSEAAITVGSSPGNLMYGSPIDWDAGDQLGPIPAQFPKGYNAFYCMKYEVSQRQWINFFNSLTPAEQANNDLTDLDHRGPNPIDRNSVEWEGTGGAYTSNPYNPVSFLLWGEIMAYMDWSGLRPISELEFVKACRGSGPVVPEGYAWGTRDIIDPSFTYDLLNEGAENELLVNHVSGIGNANWINSAIFEDGPYRCGIFAASAANATREDVGATYYGIMEMSGNLSEMAVTIGTPEGRAYKGVHGDGILDANGEADVLTWPPITGEGGGLFGGSWFSLPECLWINDRRSATVGNVGYFNDVGFRCVRTAP